MISGLSLTVESSVNISYYLVQYVAFLFPADVWASHSWRRRSRHV